MRAHLRVLFITMFVGAVGWGGVAEAAPFIQRPLTLSRSDWSLDLGLGLHHIRAGNPDNDITGFGLNLEAMVGITSFVQASVSIATERSPRPTSSAACSTSRPTGPTVTPSPTRRSR
jgi:hypothetical protein